MRFSHMMVAVALSGLVACTNEKPITSSRLATEGASVQGMPYALPRGLVSVTIGGNEGLKSNGLEYFPDPSARYVARLNLSTTANDTLKVETNPLGLLTSANGTSEDSTAEIVAAATEGVGKILRGERLRGERATAGPVKGTFLIDPFEHNSALPFDVRAAFLDPETKRHHTSGGAARRPPCPASASFCVPVLTPVVLTIDVNQQQFNISTVVPDPYRIIGVDVHRHACVQTDNQLTFNNGVMTSYNITKPSEVVGCLSIPLDIIGAIVAAPVNALTGRKKRLDAEKDLLKSQKDLLDAQAALLAAAAKPQEAP